MNSSSSFGDLSDGPAGGPVIVGSLPEKELKKESVVICLSRILVLIAASISINYTN